MNKKVMSLVLAVSMVFTSIPFGMADASTVGSVSSMTVKSASLGAITATGDSVTATSAGVTATPAGVTTTPAVTTETPVSPTTQPAITQTATPSATEMATEGAVATATPEPTEITTPATPVISEIRGGNKRIKMYWDKVSGATGYYIYYSSSKNGTYVKLKDIVKQTTVKYTKTGLSQNTTYYFKISAYASNGTTIKESALSTYGSAKTKAVSATSKAAKLYSSKAKFKASAVYKKFASLKSANLNKSFAIPGLKNTNVAGFGTTHMVPQGMCTAGAYILISAYDSTGLDESVVYVMSKSSKSYITTIVLPSKAKVAGMAYDGSNIWISKGSNVACFPYSVVTEAVNNGTSYSKLSAYSQIIAVSTTASYMGYYDGTLWVGGSNINSWTYMYGYDIAKASTGVTLTRTYRMKVPNRTQGVTFDSSGYMYLTRSYRTNSSKTKYMSQMRTYAPSFASPTSAGTVAKNSVKKVTKLAPMVEGVTIYGNYVYTLYSGAHYASCKYQVDRVIAIKKANVL